MEDTIGWIQKFYVRVTFALAKKQLYYKEEYLEFN